MCTSHPLQSVVDAAELLLVPDVVVEKFPTGGTFTDKDMSTVSKAVALATVAPLNRPRFLNRGAIAWSACSATGRVMRVARGRSSDFLFNVLVRALASARMKYPN